MKNTIDVYFEKNYEAWAAIALPENDAEFHDTDKKDNRRVLVGREEDWKIAGLSGLATSIKKIKYSYDFRFNLAVHISDDYLFSVISKNMWIWRNNDWKTRAGKEIDHIPLLNELIELTKWDDVLIQRSSKPNEVALAATANAYKYDYPKELTMTHILRSYFPDGSEFMTEREDIMNERGNMLSAAGF